MVSTVTDRGQLIKELRNSVPSRRSTLTATFAQANSTPTSGTTGPIAGTSFPDGATTRHSWAVKTRERGIDQPFYVRYFWFQNGGTTGDCTVTTWVLTVGDGDSMAVTPTETAVTDAGTADDDFHVSPWSAALTTTGTYVAEDMLHVGLERTGGSDAFAGEMLIIGVELSYIVTDTSGWLST